MSLPITLIKVLIWTILIYITFNYFEISNINELNFAMEEKFMNPNRNVTTGFDTGNSGSASFDKIYTIGYA